MLLFILGFILGLVAGVVCGFLLIFWSVRQPESGTLKTLNRVAKESDEYR